MNYKGAFMGLGLSLTLFLSAPCARAAAVTLQWNGSGCPKFEERVEISGDKIQAKRVVTGAFAVKKGTGVRLMESRKNCALLVTSVGGDTQFALEKIVIEGQAPSANSQQELTVDVSSQGQSQTKSITLKGKHGADAKFSVDKLLTDADQQWSPCDRGLMINAKQKIEGSEKVLAASIDTLHYQMKSKPCGK